MNREQRRRAAKSGRAAKGQDATPQLPSESAVPSPTDAVVSQATALFRAGQVDRALHLLDGGLQVAPHTPQLLNARAVIRGQRGDLAAAIADLETATRHAPDRYGYWNNLGNLYRTAGRLSEAIACYQRSIRLAPQVADTHFNLGVALTECEDADAAIAAFEQALALSPFHPRARVSLADVLQVKGDLDRAVASYCAALALQPDSPHVLRSLGVALYRKGDLQGAQRAYEQVLALEPFSTEALSNLAIALYEQGDADRAVACYREALNIAPQAPEAHLNLGFLYAQRGETDAAIACYDAILAREPRSATALAGKADALAQAARWPEAVAACDALLALNPHAVDTLVRLGIAWHELGDRAAALAHLQQALAIAPQHTRACAYLGAIAATHCAKGVWEGDLSRWQSAFACDRVVRRYTLAVGDRAVDRDAFHAELARYIQQHPTLLAQRPGKPIHHGRQTHEIFYDDAPVMAILRAEIDRCLRDYFAECAATNNPYFQTVPEAWQLSGWAVVLSSEGYQDPHIHPESVCSGVYYVQVPVEIQQAGDRSGALEFGRSPLTPDREADLSVVPAEGLLVLFPSYLWHGTVPFTASRDRICVSFNVLPLRAPYRALNKN